MMPRPSTRKLQFHERTKGHFPSSKQLFNAFHSELMVELRVAIDPKLIIGIRWLIFADSADLHIWKRLWNDWCIMLQKGGVAWLTCSMMLVKYAVYVQWNSNRLNDFHKFAASFPRAWLPAKMSAKHIRVSGKWIQSYLDTRRAQVVFGGRQTHKICQQIASQHRNIMQYSICKSAM